REVEALGAPTDDWRRAPALRACVGSSALGGSALVSTRRAVGQGCCLALPARALAERRDRMARRARGLRRSSRVLQRTAARAVCRDRVRRACRRPWRKPRRGAGGGGDGALA